MADDAGTLPASDRASWQMGADMVTFDADSGLGGEAKHLVTPGAPHSVSVRVSAQGRLLLVGDLSAGYRFYRRP